MTKKVKELKAGRICRHVIVMIEAEQVLVGRKPKRILLSQRMYDALLKEIFAEDPQPVHGLKIGNVEIDRDEK